MSNVTKCQSVYGEERISACFNAAKAFIPFITCGDPDLATTRKLVHTLVDAGASLIELGIPFSDPTAEGPVIMAASERALHGGGKGGVTTDQIFDLVATLRQEDGIELPLVFMTYANVVYSYGTERFMVRCAEVGIDGLILPDVPYEEKDEFEAPARAQGLALISMIAPTSHERIAAIATNAHGFIYVVSSLGVTGTRTSFSSDLATVVATIKQHTKLPCAIGFGIATPEQAATMGKLAEGAIVGSAIVKLIAAHGTNAPEVVGPYVRSMVAALRGPGAEPAN